MIKPPIAANDLAVGEARAELERRMKAKAELDRQMPTKPHIILRRAPGHLPDDAWWHGIAIEERPGGARGYVGGTDSPLFGEAVRWCIEANARAAEGPNDRYPNTLLAEPRELEPAHLGPERVTRHWHCTHCLHETVSDPGPRDNPPDSHLPVTRPARGQRTRIVFGSSPCPGRLVPVEYVRADRVEMPTGQERAA